MASQNLNALSELISIIDERASADAQNSYTSQLLQAGTEKCAKKFGEEAVELVIAAIKNDKDEIRSETADVIYHLLVLLKSSGVELSDVLAELEKRFSKSGLEEKASRNSNQM